MARRVPGRDHHRPAEDPGGCRPVESGRRLIVDPVPSCVSRSPSHTDQQPGPPHSRSSSRCPGRRWQRWCGGPASIHRRSICAAAGPIRGQATVATSMGCCTCVATGGAHRRGRWRRPSDRHARRTVGGGEAPPSSAVNPPTPVGSPLGPILTRCRGRRMAAGRAHRRGELPPPVGGAASEGPRTGRTPGCGRRSRCRPCRRPTGGGRRRRTSARTPHWPRACGRRGERSLRGHDDRAPHRF